MNYVLIKKIIEEIIRNHTCPECRSSYSEQNVILHTNTKTKSVDITLTCSKCSLSWMVKADVYMWWANVESNLWESKNKINDKDIITLSKKLKWNINIADIFKE